MDGYGDKEIQVNQCDSDMWQVMTSHLTNLGPNRWDGSREKKGRKEIKKGEP